MRKLKTHKGFGIYQANANELREGASEYYVFLPDESPLELCSPEFECSSVRECLDNINSY
jgi:hypothetical protein